MVLTWATRCGDRLAGAIAVGNLGAADQASHGLDIVGRNAIIRDPAYHNGQYYRSRARPGGGFGHPRRMLGHITYLSLEAMTQNSTPSGFVPARSKPNSKPNFSVGSYLAYQRRPLRRTLSTPTATLP